MHIIIQNRMLLCCLALFLLGNSPLLSQDFVEVGRFGTTGNNDGQFNNPKAIAISSDKLVYVADTGNDRIQLFDLKGNFIKSIGGFGFKDDQFDEPVDIWVNSLINVYVSDYNNRRVVRYDRSMNFISNLENNKGLESDFQFFEVASCAVNQQNEIFVLDHDEYKIIKSSREGRAERVFGLFDSGPGELFLPEQLEIWDNKMLLVSDSEARKIVVFDFFGNYVRNIEYEAFKSPRGLEVDLKKNIYIADPQAKSVFIVNPGFKKIDTVKCSTGFKSPQDVATIYEGKMLYLYILENDHVKILRTVQ